MKVIWGLSDFQRQKKKKVNCFLDNLTHTFNSLFLLIFNSLIVFVLATLLLIESFLCVFVCVCTNTCSHVRLCVSQPLCYLCHTLMMFSYY